MHDVCVDCCANIKNTRFSLVKINLITLNFNN